MNESHRSSRTSFPYMHELTAEECIELKRALCYPWELEPPYRGIPIEHGTTIDTDRQCLWFQLDVRHREANDEHDRRVS